MHPHTPAQAPNCLTPCTPAPSDKHGPESAYPCPRGDADLAQSMGQSPALADDVCASAHGSYGFTRIQRACEVGRVPEPIFFRGMWRGHIALKNGRRLVAEFATKVDAADWIRCQFVQRRAETLPPAPCRVTDDKLLRCYAWFSKATVDGHFAQADREVSVTAGAHHG